MTVSESASIMTGRRNVDARELAYYEALAHTWWDRSGPFWPLHALNELRTDYLRSVLGGMFGLEPDGPRGLAGLNILDVGCGGGILSESIARAGACVHGIDVVEKNVAVAHHHARGSQLPVRYEVTTASELVERGLVYDVVLNMEVVEHVPDMPTLINECARLVAPGGVMVLATINRTFIAWVFAILGAEYVLRWLPRGTHRWGRFVTPVELERTLRSNGLRTVDETGVRVNPFNRRFTLTRRKSVNYMLIARREGAPARRDRASPAPAGLAEHGTVGNGK